MFNDTSAAQAMPAQPLSGQEPFASIKRATELAWAAGFMDGEACVYISKTHTAGRKNQSYRLAINIPQNHRGTLERLAKVLEVPCNLRTIERTEMQNRDGYALLICDGTAHDVLGKVMPYLVRKGPEARVAVKAYVDGHFNVHPGPKGHDADIWKIRQRAYRKLQRMK